jgi:RND family efflux transporter MFP subunit
MSMQNTAPVYSIADEQRARAESAAWSRFASATDSAEFCASWLTLLSGRIGRARAALLLLGEQETGPFTVAAAWPDPQRDLQYLGKVAQRTLAERRGVVADADGAEPVPERPAHVGYPLEVAGRLHGAVVFDIGSGPLPDLQAALRQIHWASAWLVDHFRQQALLAAQAELGRVGQLNELMAAGLQQRKLQPSALAVANELAARLQCDRVTVGMEERDRMVPLAMSHTATFDKKSDLVRTLGEAMDEVLDLGVPVLIPQPEGDELGAIAHAQAAQTLDTQAMLSVPVVHEAHTIGAITLERQRGPVFTEPELRLARAAGVMLGPAWALQRLNERSWWQRLRDRWHDGLQSLFGPRNPGAKLVAGVLSLLVLTLALWQADHRVSARTVIEGATQIARVAPFDGFIAQGLVRAGDTVKRGQPMARLEDRDLKLERARWSAELEQAQRKYQVAMAQADRGNMGVMAAQMHQAEAQLALVEEKLARAELTAPFDGVVVSGDLSQQIGTPVEQGRTLFEVAPLEGFRVVLQVDDRDIARVAVGQKGELVLSSLPDRALPFTLSSVTSVATQHDGRNVFRVEAQVPAGPERLRPGMEGIGKVVVGERSLLWIWTHGFFDWLRLTLWSWMP